MSKGNTRNSEPAVRNGSELLSLMAANQVQKEHAEPSRTGRPPVLDDEELDALTDLLRRKLARMPRLDELIEAAGGCQRLRASKALQRARSTTARLELQDMLRIPADLERLQRQWISQWIQAASEQLADHHAQLVARHEERVEALESLISEQHLALSSLRDQKADLERITEELLKVRDQDRVRIERLTAERDIAERLARG